MLLDAGASSTKITDENWEDPSDAFLSYIDDNYDENDNVLNDLLDETYNETSINCNGDVSKIAINDILQEMRLHSPVENDFLSDLFGDEPTDIFCQIGNNDPKVNGNHYDNNFNQNYAFQGQHSGATTSDNNLLDSLLTDLSCGTPDVQMEINDGVQFQYDVMDLINGEPAITLPYPEPDSTTQSIEDTSGYVDYKDIVNYDGNNEGNYNLEPVVNQTNNISDNQYFPCSTNLPMTHDELQQDIQNYLNTEQNHSFASFYEYAELICGTSDAQPNNTYNSPYSSDLLQEYIDEQNHLMNTLEPINPINLFETPNLPAPEAQQSDTIYQCTDCAFYTYTYHGLCIHKREHAPDPLLVCTQCDFATATPYDMRTHQAYGHENAYYCQTCSYVTHSNAKIRTHMRDEH